MQIWGCYWNIVVESAFCVFNSVVDNGSYPSESCFSQYSFIVCSEIQLCHSYPIEPFNEGFHLGDPRA